MMNGLLKSEALKLRTLRSTWIVAGSAVLLSAVIAAVLIRIHVTDPAQHGLPVALTDIALGVIQPLWFFVVVLAVLTSAGEFQHKTIRTTLLAAPRRSQVLLAKATTSAGFGALLVLAGIVTATIAAIVASAVSGATLQLGDVGQWSRVIAAAGIGALWAVLAAGLGMLTRSTALALTALLLWRFVVEALLPVLTGNAGITAWTPSGAARALVGLGGPNLPAWEAVPLFGGYALAVTAAATLLFARTDPS